MMKKTLCLLLALALCLPLLPAAALAEDGTAGEDRQLYFCWDGNEADPLTELRFEPRESISGFFRIPLADGTFQRIDHKEVNIVFVPDEGTATDAISFSWDAEEEEWPSSVWFDTFGAGRLVYTDETGVRYSMAAACVLPSEGFSTATTLTEETYLEHAAYCPLNQPFYFVFTENIQVTEVSAAVVRGSTATVTAEVLSDHPNVCSFVITNAVFSDQYVDGCLMLDASFLLADRSTRHTSFLFSDPAPRFGFQDADFPGHFFSSLNAEIRSVFSLNFGVDDQGVFRPVTVTSAVYVPEVDTRSDALAVCQTEDGWQLSALHVGQGTLQCTAQDGTVYTLPITIALPEQGFSTGTTLTEETCLVNRSVDYVQGQVFYYVFPAGRKITAVTPTLYDDNAQVQTEILSDQPNVCRFTLTACGTAFRTALDASFQLEDGSAWTDCIGLQNPAPCFGFRLYNPDGTFEDDLLCSVVPTVGLINRLGFFLNSGDESVLLDIASVAFLPAEGTAQDAMTAAALSNGVWKLSFRKVGRGTLQCAARDGTVYTLPVDIALPPAGFFSERRMAAETYLPFYDFDETAEEHVVWFMTKNGFSADDITNWAGRDRLDAPVTLKAYLQAETVAREDDSGRYDIKLTIQAIPGCRLTVWPEHANGTHYVDEELEILNTKKLERLTPLDAPTDLAWAGDYPGDIRCKSGALFQDHLLWTLYQVGNPTPLARRETAYSGRYDPDSWRVDDLFWRSYRDYPDRESGDYYFTVQAVGDEEQYKDSPVVTSPIWHYERPEAALAAPSDLHWEGQTACWSDESNRAADLYGYEIQFRCVAPETEAETRTKYTLTMDDLSSDGLKHTLQDWVKDLLGSGTCQFRLRAVSGDITRFRHGQWSEFNEVGTQLTAPSTVADALDQLLTDYTPSEGAKLTEKQTAALKSAVAEKKDALASTLCTGDGGSTKVADKLQALEALVGGPATVTVTGDAPKEIKDAQNGVSIVGASLNGTAESAVSLKIDRAEAVSVEAPNNPAQYHNTIPFSMTLEGVNAQEQHQSLAVPVLITLPLPGSIRPSFLVLLHKIGDDWQEIFPYQVFYDETLRQNCVRFTVTSFSDFAFAQQLFCGIQQLNADNGQLTVCATADVKKVVAAVYDGSGKQLGCAASAIENGGTLTLDLPALKTGAAVRVFFLNKNGQPVCPAAEQNI